MEAAAATRRSSPSEATRRPFGAILKPITRGFKLFFEGMFSTVSLGNSDAMETLSHLDDSTASPIPEHEERKGVTSASGKPAVSRQTSIPEIIACPAATPAPVNSTTVRENNYAVANNEQQDSQRMNAESPAVVTAATQGAIASPQADATVAAAVDALGTDAQVTNNASEAQQIQHVESPRKDAIPTVSEDVNNTANFAVREPENPLETSVEGKSIADASVKLDNATLPTSEPEAATNPQSTSPAAIENIVFNQTFIAKDAIEHTAVGGDEGYLDTNTGVDFEDEDEEEFSEGSDVDYMGTISDEEEELIPAPVFPLIFEDDFDAPVSSVFHQDDLDLLMDSDTAWWVPQIGEKAKSEREVAREELANQWATGYYDDEYMRLEQAASALTIDGVPVQLQTSHKAAALPTHIPPHIPQHYPQYYPQHYPQHYPQNYPQNYPQHYPAHYPEHFPQNYPQHMPQYVPQHVPQHMPQNMPQHMPQNMPRYIPQHMPQYTPQHMPQHTLQHVPQHFPPAMPYTAAPGAHFVQAEVGDAPIRNHSRSTSASSWASKGSADAIFDHPPCPGTPMTEYTGVPAREAASHAPFFSEKKTVPQQALRADRTTKAVRIANETRTIHTPTSFPPNVYGTRN
ncbi:hypothetical protein VTH82DRAFT_6048 [Thermothelomyces myriococcoides]